MKIPRMLLVMVVLTILAMVLLPACSKSVEAPTTSSTPVTTAKTATPSANSTSTTAPKATTSTSTAAPPAPTGPYGELRVAVSDFTDTAMDPIDTGPNFFSAMLFEWPIGVKTGTNQLAGAMIESWAMAADGLSWTFTLRKGLKFQNGDPVTSADLKFSIDRFSLPESRNQYMAQMVAKTDVVDALTVRCTTIGTQPYMAVQMSSMGSAPFIQPKTYFEKVGHDAFEKNPIGAGPWKLSSIFPGDSAKFDAFDVGWRPAPAFKTLVMMNVPEEGTRTAVMKTDAADIAEMSLEGSMALEKAGFRLSQMAPSAPMIDLIGAYHPLAAKLPTGDIKVRRALSMAIDRAEIMKSFFYAKANPPTPPFAPSNTPADVDIAYWKDYAVKNYPFDPVAAVQLLKDAGYANGFSIKMITQPEAEIPNMPELAQVIAGYWLKIGVKATVQVVDDSVWKSVRNPFAKGVTDGVGWAATYSMNVSGNVARQMDSGFRSKGSLGLLGANADVDALVAASYSEMDQVKRQQIIAQIIKAGFDAYSAMVICEVPVFVVQGPKVNLPLTGFDIALPPALENVTHRP